jgi:hypothetical protein
MFCQSTEDSVLGIGLDIDECDGRRSRTFEVIMHRATLLAYYRDADGARVALTATATIAADDDTERSLDDGGAPWDARRP